jgi:hypothetical protein
MHPGICIPLGLGKRFPDISSLVISGGGAGSSTATLSFSSGLGAPAADRLMIVNLVCADNAVDFNILNATISGVAAGIVQSNAAAITRKAAILYALVPTDAGGTDVVVNYSESMTYNTNAFAYRVTGLDSPTPVDIKTAQSGSATSLSATLQMLSGRPPGAVFLSAVWHNSVTLSSNIGLVSTGAANSGTRGTRGTTTPYDNADLFVEVTSDGAAAACAIAAAVFR